MNSPKNLYHSLAGAIVLLALLIMPFYASGQSPEYRNFSVKDGLPSSEVYCAMQDSKGYMWFATDRGVCRFDGYQFKVFNTGNGLVDNTVFECQEDYKGRIWFKSISGRLCYYLNDSIYKLPINDTLVKILSISSVVSMSIDTLDNLYLGLHFFEHGIIKIDLAHNYKISIINIPMQITYLMYTPGGKMITGDNFIRKTTTKPIPASEHPVFLYSYNPGSSTIRLIKSWPWKIGGASEIHDKAIILPDNKLVASISSDFLVIDTASKKIASRLEFPDDILNISSDRKNNIWVTHESASDRLRNLKTIDKRSLPFLNDNLITSITTDKEGGTWFTTLYGGVYYVGTLEYKTYSSANGLTGNKVTAEAIADDGTVWATSEHSNKIKLIYGDSIAYRTLPNIEALSVNSISFHGNEVFINSTGGEYVYDAKTFNLICNDRIGHYKTIFNANGTEWANCYSSVDIYKITGNQLIRKKTFAFNSKVFSFCKDSIDKSIWVGTLKGLWNIANDTMRFLGDRFPELKKRIDDLLESGRGDLWIATRDTGIIIKRGNSLTHITTKDGLLSNFCQSLCMDDKGDIWVGANRGISHIILNRKSYGKLIDTIINISAPNLIEVNKIVSHNDTIYAATGNGLTIFNSNTVSYNRLPPPIYITNLTINNKKIPVSQAYNLSYDENYLLISFVGLTYKDAGNTQYRYKMEGIDTGWLYTRNRDVQYPKLAPSEYKFIVSAMNNDGIWSSHEATMQFNISPPFWATWWARSVFIAVILAFIYWRFKLVESRTKKQAEVNKQILSMELRELKAQMDPHFLFNNLNTLTHLVEVKSDDAPEFVEELSKYYRYSLQFRNTEFTTLENELKQAERYLHILKIRFGDNIKVKWDINDSYKSFYIATYSLQLLLENITKHNIVSADKPLWVEIITTDQNSLLIKNQLQPKNSGALSTGHGLKSISQRYQLLTNKKIEVKQSSQFFSVELPLISPSEYENTYS